MTVEVSGPWSLVTSRRFWESFTPNALADQESSDVLHAVFRVERDWSRAEVDVKQHGANASITVRGDGDLESATAQVSRFLSLDVDGRDWPEVGARDPVIADGQKRLPGLRPCGFYSPYEAAAWSVLSQRIRMVQAAKLRDELVHVYGDDGAFPSPARLHSAELDLPGRKVEYLRAVAEAAMDGQLAGATLRAMPPSDALDQVQQVRGLGQFAAELVVIRGANAPDLVPRQERRLEDEVTVQYGSGADLHTVAEKWRPFRTWASVLLRTLRENREQEGKTRA